MDLENDNKDEYCGCVFIGREPNCSESERERKGVREMDYHERELLLNEIEETLNQIIKSEVPEESLLEQYEIFRKGLPYVKLIKPCTIGDGISLIPLHEFENLLELHRKACMEGRIMKFVPASGAATRMFQDLNAALNKEDSLSFEDLRKRATTDKGAKATVTFIENIEKFAFIDTMSKNGVQLASLLKQGEWKTILRYLLGPQGLNYANLPKGLIPFHKYPEGPRTPLYEHLMEAVEYSTRGHGEAIVHFTFSEEHLSAAQEHIDAVKSRVPQCRKFDISLSVQKRSTDTIALTLENEPFRDAQGKLLFRPGGHGALLENLNDLKGDIVSIKNIDNVCHDRLKAETILYKKLLCGYLIKIQNKVFDYLRRLKNGPVGESTIGEITQFAREYLSTVLPDKVAGSSLQVRREYLFAKLNRPLRVCGMVKNEGEPGGGPFWTIDTTGEISLQIVESAQVDVKDDEQKEILASSTHFNPVDLVCGLRDFEGGCFHLPAFSDKNTGFITIKSKDGRELKALELPGLWNGGMAFWNTVFVEVPSSTFTPVKTVIDLLRPEHQP